MSKYTHLKTVITDRRQKVSEMYLRGMYMADIAKEIGVDTATVSRDLAECRKLWMANSINHIDQKKANELAKLDHLETTYWEAWDRSQEDAVTNITRHFPAGDTSEVKTVGQAGNPAFLDGIIKCIVQRCTILGIEAPKKAEVTGTIINLDVALADYKAAAEKVWGNKDDKPAA